MPINLNMKLKNLNVRDLGQEGANPIPGQFIIELFPEPDEGGPSIRDTGMLPWLYDIFNGKENFESLFPGNVCMYSMTDWNPPFVGMQVSDLRDPANQAYIDSVTDSEDIAHIQSIKASQDKICSEMNTDNLAEAITCRVLSRMVNKNQMPLADACKILNEQFDEGQQASIALIRRATALNASMDGIKI